MSSARVPVLLLCTVVILLVVPVSAQEWMDCSQCDPWASYCEETCSYCANGNIDYCPKWAQVTTTCGEYQYACLREGCGPNWQISSYENVGTYGETTYGYGCEATNCGPSGCSGWDCGPMYGCEHHRVDRVVYHDVHECNVNSYFWNKPGCVDYVDATKPFERHWSPSAAPDCCDPFTCAEYPDPRCYYNDTFTCNHWHNC